MCVVFKCIKVVNLHNFFLYAVHVVCVPPYSELNLKFSSNETFELGILCSCVTFIRSLDAIKKIVLTIFSNRIKFTMIPILLCLSSTYLSCKSFLHYLFHFLAPYVSKQMKGHDIVYCCSIL